MLELLRNGDLRVTEVAEPFSVSLAAASKHIRVLESAGLLAVGGQAMEPTIASLWPRPSGRPPRLA